MVDKLVIYFTRVRPEWVGFTAFAFCVFFVLVSILAALFFLFSAFGGNLLLLFPAAGAAALLYSVLYNSLRK